MDRSDFVHLHVHSDHSLLDGLAKVPALVSKAQRCGQTAIALTDHGTVSGSIGFWKECKKAGIKPILGCEIYQSIGRMGERQKGYHHLTVLAKNDVGWRNLSKITSLANLQGYYYRPRVDEETLLAHREGLIVLSGCLKGPIPTRIQQDDPDEARRIAARMKEAWGEDFYLEIQPNGLEQQHKVNRGCVELANELGIELAATCDLHYLEPEDAFAQEVRICISSGKTLDDEGRLKMKDEFYFKDSEQMIAAFKELPRAITNTRAIAEKVGAYDLLPGTRNEYFLPTYLPPDGSEPLDYFKRQCEAGMIKRYGVEPRKEIRERLEYEISVIEKLKLFNYLLIVADFIGWAKRNECPVGPGRGSAAGSVVAYCLEITDIDPMPYDLLFERFLNPERVSMPDIDVDFCETNRPRVIEYVRDKYGQDNVCQIVTFGTLKPKAAVKDVGRVLGMPYADVDKISKLIPEGPKLQSLEQAFQESPELKALRDDPRYAQLFDLAVRLEGINRHAGKHAAGVVISDRDLIERIALTQVKGDKTTQFTMTEVEECGLLKMDFLGLRTLTLIEDTLRLIKRSRGPEAVPDMDHLPLDDPKTFELLARGDTAGVFQLESSGFRKLLKEAKPDRFEDIIALIALYRPGPLGSGMDQQWINRKHKREPITYLTPELEPVLSETYGCILYQEQVMRIANKVAGFSLAEADTLRKAMGKKKADLMEKYRAAFVQGFVARGISEAIATEVWSQVEFFSGYGFNKCLARNALIQDATTGERTTVGDLFDHRRPFTVHALDDRWRLRPRRVIDVMSNGVRPVFELRTRQGKTITATGNHPFRVLDGWKNLEDLKPGDRIAAPRHLSVPTTKSWPRHELIALGWLLSEGNLCHPSSLYIDNKDPAAIEDFAAAARGFPETQVTIRERNDRPGSHYVSLSCGERGSNTPWNKGNRGGVAVMPKPRIRSGAYLWAERLGILGKGATTKDVPAEVFTLRDEDIELFLGRLWAGDGFIANATQAVPFYATSSPQLARDVQELLLRLGITSGIHEKHFKYRGGFKPGYTVHLVGEGARETFARRILPHCVGRESAARLLEKNLESTTRGQTSKDTIPTEVRAWIAEERERAGLTWNEIEERSGVCVKELIGTGSPKKRGFRRGTVGDLGEYFESQRLRDLATSDVFWDEVVSIEPKGEEETFDLTVEEDHNFVADGLIVHNSHSAAYGLVTYRTAFLKAHFPVEFMAATLTSWTGDTDRLVEFKAECDRAGIAVVPPDINRSEPLFSVQEGKIVYGLAAIRGMGEGVSNAIVAAREKLPEQRFRSMFHLASEVDAGVLTKATLETLVSAGAFDSLGANRRQLYEVIEQALQMGLQDQKDRQSKQQDLFGGASKAKVDLEKVERELLPKVPEWKDAELLAHEKEALGFYLTRHPLDRHRELLQRYTRTPLSSLPELNDKSEVTVGAMITALRTILDKKGNQMAFLSLEDFTGTCEAVVFSKVYADVRQHLREENAVFVQGRIDKGREPPSIMVDKILALEQAEGALGVAVQAELVLEETTQETLRRFREVLLANQGADPVYYSIRRRSDHAVAGPYRVGSSFRVRGSDALRAQLLEVLGPSASVSLRPR